MGVKTMKSINYNMLMTLLKLFGDTVPTISSEYNFNQDIQVVPSYPNDLTKIEKPSIVIREVGSDICSIGMGRVLGQHYDTDVDSYSDVYGNKYDMLYQFDAVAHNNSSLALLTSMICDGVLINLLCNNNGKFDILDFTAQGNPPIGTVSIIGEPSVSNIYSANKEFINAIRCRFALIQTVMPQQEYVDLSKWIKQSYTIKL